MTRPMLLIVLCWRVAAAADGTVDPTRTLHVLVAAEPPRMTLPATVLRVIDGDSAEVEVAPWPNLRVETNLRVAGIDAPELFHPRCDAEKKKAQAAKDALAGLVGTGKVWLVDPKPDKFGDRTDAQVFLPDGTDVGAALIARGLAKPYGGRGPKPAWCGGLP